MSCLSPFSFFFFSLGNLWGRGNGQPLGLLIPLQLFHPVGVTGTSSSSDSNAMLPFQSWSIRQKPKMSETILETLLEGVEMPSPIGDFRLLAFLQAWNSGFHKQGHLHALRSWELLRGQQIYPLNGKPSGVLPTPVTSFLFSLSILRAHVNGCGICCAFSVRSQTAFTVCWPCAKLDAKSLYQRVHSAERSRQQISQLLWIKAFKIISQNKKVG